MVDKDRRGPPDTRPTIATEAFNTGGDIVTLDVLGDVERYDVGTILGVGGMGEVRLCTDRRIGRQVAMKLMRADAHLDEPEMRARFFNEARVQGQTEHPSIVPVYDVGTNVAGSLYFTMRHVEGRTLTDILNGLRSKSESFEREYSRHKLLTAFGSACLAVHFAHTRGVFHCDIKPANIMFGAFGELYVLDWGIAMRAPSPTAPTEGADKHHVNGTPGYMAPEQIRGEALDARCDVYSLGALLYEMLTLEPMHAGATDERCLATLQGEIVPPSARAPNRNIAPELDAICAKATALVTASRYASGRDLYDDLERYLEGDRDLLRRRAMSREHAAHAASMAERAHNGPDSSPARSEALRAVGRALALDPDNEAALRILVGLITEPPAETPAEAVEDIHATERSLDRPRALGGLVGLLLLAMIFPAVCLLQGIRNVSEFYVVAVAGLAAAGLGALRVWRPRGDGFAPVYLPIALSIVVGVVGACFHPTVFTPSIAMPFAVGYTLSMGPRHRFVPMIACSVALVLPSVLEWFRVLPPSSILRGELSCVMPRIAVLPPLNGILLVFGNVTCVIGACYYALRFRSVLSETQRRVCVAAWQLRQLLPRELKSITTTPADG